jgi:hypothetical protein
VEASEDGSVAHRDEVAHRRSDPEVTEYLNEARYRADHPGGRPIRDHNAVVRELCARRYGATSIVVVEWSDEVGSTLFCIVSPNRYVDLICPHCHHSWTVPREHADKPPACPACSSRVNQS